MPETDAAVHITNANKVLTERRPELWGKHVAWSEDGTRTLAIAESMEELDAKIRQLGLTSEEYVLDRVPAPDELWMFLDGLPKEEQNMTLFIQRLRTVSSSNRRRLRKPSRRCVRSCRLHL